MCCQLILAVALSALAVCTANPVTSSTELGTGVETERFLAAWEKLAAVQDEFDYNSGCHCTKYTCGCCVDVKAKGIHFKSACVNLTYLPADIGIEVTFSINGKVYIHTKVSARNPPALCIGIPELKKQASVCLNFYNMDVSKSKFSGCVRLEVKFLHMTLAKVNIGCFNIPLEVDAQSPNAVPLIALQEAQRIPVFLFKDSSNGIDQM